MEPTYPEEVPKEVQEDAIEAHRCFSVGAWRATAAMARRAIQGSALDKQAPPNKKLIEQIDWLENQRLIPPLMNEVAHKIRTVGNVGAHPDKDGLHDVDDAEAKRMLMFLGDFIRYVYELPADLKTLAQPAAADLT
jgi:hypothetical protein